MDDYHRPENLLSLQRYFLRTMFERPDYANYVRSFCWTLIWYDQHKEEGLTETDYQLWAIFSRMESVTKLDLAAIPQDKTLDPYTHEIPRILFLRVTDLRLLGWVPHNLVTNILNSIDLSQLRALRLDALQEEGRESDGSLMTEDFNIEHWDDVERAQLCRRRRRGSLPEDIRVIFPGPMWIPFISFIGKLTSLQNLEIRIPPLEDARLGDCSEHMTYISVMAELIESVLPSLEKLTIGFARGTMIHYRGYYQGLPQRLRTSELMLISFFPSLSIDEWKCESLRKVSLEGFLQYKEHVGDPSEMQTGSRKVCLLNLQHMANIRTIQVKIQVSLSRQGGILEWSDDSPRPAFLYMGLM